MDKRSLAGDTAVKAKIETSRKGTDEDRLQLYSQDDLKVIWDGVADEPTRVVKITFGAGKTLQEIIIKANNLTNKHRLNHNLTKDVASLATVVTGSEKASPFSGINIGTDTSNTNHNNMQDNVSIKDATIGDHTNSHNTENYFPVIINHNYYYFYRPKEEPNKCEREESTSKPLKKL